MTEALRSPITSFLGRLLGGKSAERAEDSGDEPVIYRRPDGSRSGLDIADQNTRMSSWLPYIEFDKNDKFFGNRDSIGFCLEAVPQTGADKGTSDRLKGLFSRLPSHSTLQFHMFASPHVKDALRRYANLRVADLGSTSTSDRLGRPARNENVFRQMARRRYAHLNHGAFSPLVPGVGMLVRDFRLVVSVTIPGELGKFGDVDKLRDIRDGVQSTLNSARFPNEQWGANDLINWVADQLNPNRMMGDRMPRAYDDQRQVRDQCVDHDTHIDWSDPVRAVLRKMGGSEKEAMELRFLSLNGSNSTPERFGLWNMGGLIGDLFQDTLQVPCPFLITESIYIPDQQSTKSGAVTEKLKADRDAKSEIAEFSPGMAGKKEDWDMAIKAIEGGGKFVHTNHQVVLFAPHGEGKRAENAIRDVWAARGFELNTDAYMHRQALLASLPMSLSKPFFADMQRMRRETKRVSGNAIHLAPMVAEAKGSKTPVLLGVGRRGQIIGLDFYDNTEGGKNVAIIGSVGSGKSTLLEEIAASYYGIGAKVRVFDRGRSFERLASRVGAKFVRFGQEKRICVNMFSLVSEAVVHDGEVCGGINDDVAMLQPVLAKMASPNMPLDPTIYATLATVIKEEFDKKGRTMSVTDIQARYKQGRLYDDRPIDQRYYDLADMLAPFCKGGPYEALFEGPATLDFSNDFLIFELEDLSSNPHLRGVVQMILLYQITQEMLQERHRKKLFIMDEAKEALAGAGADDQAMSEFIEKLYLRVRKYNGSAITATQDVAHYHASSYGTSIFNQSDFIFMGRQSETSIAAAARNETFVIDDNLKRTLVSLGGAGGSFKEWYVHSPIFRGVMRLVINPSTLLLYSNRPEDNTPLDQRIAAGMSASEAVDDLLRERGVSEWQ
jgi:conjugal transfer ATP-binding protein TraC